MKLRHIFALLIFGAASLPAQAADDCKHYAGRAFSLDTLEEYFKCPSSHIASLPAHLANCKSIGIYNARLVENERVDQLKVCLAKMRMPNNCEEYATIGHVQSQANLTFNCGYDPNAGWSNERSAHLNHCLAVGGDLTNIHAHTKARYQMLLNCVDVNRFRPSYP